MMTGLIILAALTIMPSAKFAGRWVRPLGVKTDKPISGEARSRLVHRSLHKGGALCDHTHVGIGLRLARGFEIHIDDNGP
jgi:hypothetical protein